MPNETNGSPAAPPSTAVAELPAVPPLLNLLVSDSRLPICSFDLKTPAGRQLLQRCEEQPDEPVRELANMKFRLQHVYAKVFDFTPPDSTESYPLLRIGLVTTDGKVHCCAADGIRESLLRLIAGHGLPPWKDGVPVEVKLKATKKGHNRLILLEDFATVKGGK